MPKEQLLGRYTLLRELGRDATGMVYVARDQATGAVVALQTLDPALLAAGGGHLADAFIQNARAAARLRHANIVGVHDAGEAGGRTYVATELAEGESLRRLLDQRSLPLARALQIFDDIASALAYAHEQGMLHKGVRPSNIVVLPSGVARIGDFGIGQIGEEALRYLSPEQVRGEPADARSDLFSLGAVLYELLTRRPAFEGDSPAEIRQDILRAAPPRPSEANPLVPAALDHLVLGLLARRPEDRPANARLVLRDLHRIREGLGLKTEAAQPKQATVAQPKHETSPFERREPTFDAPPDERVLRHRERPPVPRRRKRGKALAAFAAAIAVVALGLAAAWYHPPDIAALRAQPKESKPLVVESKPLPAEEPKPVPIEQPKPLPAEEPKPPARPVQEIVKPRPQPAPTAKLIVAVSPQGELYVDGKHYGTTPPTTTFDLEPGMHRIEIRSGSRRPYLTYMTVEPGEERRIRHDFNAKAIRPPV